MGKSSFWGKVGPLVLARLISAGVTFCIPLLLARALSLPEYGTYKQLFLISTTLYHVLPFGVAQSLYFFVPRVEEKRPYFGQTLIFLLAAGALGGGLVYGLAEQIAGALNNPGLSAFRLPLAVYTACTIGAYPLEVALTSQGKTKLSAVSYLVCDGLRAGALTVPILFHQSLGTMMMAIAAFSIARLIVTWVLLLGSADGPLWNTRLFFNQLAYSAPFGAAMVLNFPQQAFHQYAVSGSVSPELFALYAVGCFQLPLVDLLYSPTSEVLMVRLGELDKGGRLEEGVSAFRDAAARLSFFFLPMAIFLFAAAPEFIRALFGAKFLPAVPIFRVSVLAVGLAILPMDGVLRARGRTRGIFLSYLAKAAITVPAVLLGVKALGMMGGILAWALAELVGKATLLAQIPSALSTPARVLRLREVIPWKDLGRASIAAVAAGLFVVAARALPVNPERALPEGFFWRAIPLGVFGAVFMVGYLAILWAAGVRPEAFLGRLRRRRIA